MESHPSSSKSAATATSEMPVGTTDFASMWLSAGKSTRAFSADRSTKSVESLVLTVVKRTFLRLEAKASIVRLVESLVWPFVARRSLRETMFSDKELHRFVNSMRDTAERIIEYDNDEDRAQTYIKYWLDSLLCREFQDSDLPVREEWNKKPLFSGWCRNFVVRHLARRDLPFFYSLQKGCKQMWPQLGKKKQNAALRKHLERCTRPPTRIPDDCLEVLRKTSLEVFDGIGQMTPTKFVPSGSACLQASRREGGALGLFSRYPLPLESREAKTIGKLPVLNATLNTWRQDEWDWAFDSVVGQVGKGMSLQTNSWSPMLDVEVVAIPEPGKFRIITKMDGPLASMLQPIQGLMLSKWKQSRFSTMLHEDLTESVRSLDKQCPNQGWVWVSVDYEAATDLLRKDATMTVMSALQHLKIRGSRIAQMSLMNGQATYRFSSIGKEKGEVIKVPYSESQFMGHPLSFAILCTINLAAYRLGLRRWVREDPSRYVDASLMENAVLVNGDDMLFRCPRSFVPTFLKAASDFGFKKSQGKNYVSPDTCMINSQTFRRVGGLMKRFGYLNMRLVKGTNVKTGDSFATPTQIGKDLSKMVRLCPWTNCVIPSAIDRFRKEKGYSHGATYRPNWYLPVHLGGYGLDPEFAPKTWKVTRSQREFAARFVADPSMALFRMESGMDVPTAKLAGALAHWRLVPSGGEVSAHESSETSDDWLARLCLAARVHHGVKFVNDVDRVVANRFRPQYRLKPMSVSTLIRYWDARLYAFSLPPCPPLSGLRIRDVFPWLEDMIKSRHAAGQVPLPL